MTDNRKQVLGALGGGIVAAGLMFFTTVLTTEEYREIVGYTGVAFFGHLAAVFGISRVTAPRP